MQLDTSYYYNEPTGNQPANVEKINKANKTKTKQNVTIFGDSRDEAINYEIQNPDRDAETIKRDIRVAGDIITGTPTVAADIAYETVEAGARFLDNTFGYVNKYNPTNRLYTDSFVLPDEKNFYFNAGGSGKGPLRYAWDQYRALGRLLDEEPVSADEYIERTRPVSVGGQVVSEIGQVLVPFMGAMKVVQAPTKLKQYGDVVEQMYRWTIAGAGTDFVFGDANPEEYDFLSFKPTEDFLGIEDSNNRLRDILEYSFLDDDDAEIFANKLDHAFNTGIVDGMFGGAFSSFYHQYKSLYKYFGGDKAFQEKYINKALAQQHGVKFSKFKQAYATDAEAFAAYMKTPALREFTKIQLRTGFTGTAPRDFNKRYDAFLKALDDQVYGKTGQVLDPLQISNAKNYGAYSGIINETRTDYTKAKNLLVDVYKRMLTNKTALRLFIGAGAAYTFMGNNAEAGVLDKSLQKIFQNGGQKLFSVAKDGKLIAITADDLVKMPLDKKILIKRDDEPDSWKVYEDKDEFLKSDDYFPANPIDLLPNQKYIYYDTLAQKISEMNFKEMPKEQFVNTINNMQGVKKDEIEATELLSFVSQFDGDKITKSALLEEWYPNSLVKMRTRLMGSDTGSGEMEEAYGRYEQYITPGDYDKYKEHLITFTPLTNPNIQLEFEKRKIILGNNNYITFTDNNRDDIKYEDLVGLPNYLNSHAELFVDGMFRENLPLNQFTIYEGDVAVARDFPATEAEAKLKLIDKYNDEVLAEIKADFPQTFKSSHFREPNILAHTRTTERDIDGTPTFFIEEVQSDWHQLGMKQGYIDDKNFNLRISDINEKLRTISGSLDKIRAKEIPGYAPGSVSDDFAIKSSEFYELQKEYSNLMDQRDVIVDMNQGKVPDAPFKNEKDWATLSLKEMVNFAAKKGYNQIAWTSGRIQNERYDIGNYVDELKVYPANDPRYKDAYILNGIQGDSVVFHETIISQNEYRDVLEETVGKSLADKIRLAEKEAPDEFNKFGLSFTGLDLNLGSGQKMDRFYDKLIPSLLEKLYKNDGVQFYQSQLQTEKDAQPAPFEEMQDDLMYEAHERVYITELTEKQIKDYNKRNPDNKVIKKEGYEIWGLVQDDFVVEAKLFEIADERQIEAPLEKLFAVEKGYERVPPRLEGDTQDRAYDYFEDQESDAISEIQDQLYQDYVRDFNIEKGDEAIETMRTINIMTIPENLKDRVLKLGQPLFGNSPSKLGSYQK